MRRISPTAALISLLSIGGPAGAQGTGEVTASPTDETGQALERMTVTGSRVARVPLEGAYPVTVIDRDTLLASGEVTIGEYLQQLPFMSGSPLNTSTNVRGAGGGLSRGIATLELRGLGPERTLVLLNGRRVVPGGNGASGVVDLNLIPMSWVSEVQVLNTGASVEYGADAVAGVVNIITRDDLHGLELSMNGRVTDRGDGDTLEVSGVWGRQFARGHVLAGLEHFDQQALGKGERAFSRQWLTVSGPDNQVVNNGSSAPPGGNFRLADGRVTLRAGAAGTSPDDFRPFINEGPDNDRFNFNPFEDLLQDSTRTTLFASGDHDLSAATTLLFEVAWQQRDSDTRIAPLPLFTNRETDVAVAADNVYNPFGERITDARRRLIEAGPRQYRQDNESWRVLVGAEGQVGDWLWDTSLNRARNRTDQQQDGDLLDDRLRLALGPSFIDASGAAVCGTPEQPIAGCVPLNLFGGPGSVTPEMIDYVGADLDDSGYNEQTVVSLNLQGDLAQLRHGPLAAAFGYEYRQERAGDFPDPQTVAGNTSGAARAITEGEFDSNEVYAAVGVPLLRNAPLAQSLDLDLGGRWVDFSNFDSQLVYEGALIWRPTTEWVVRAAYGEAFRAPTVRELFGGVTQSNPILTDPCADFSQLTPVEIDRCVAQGVPADGSFDQNGNETPQLGGGNPALAAEQAQTLTAGFTWQPAAWPGLLVNLDYYDIEIDGGIGSLGATTVLDQCLATGAASFCERIDRGADGAVTQVRSELQNIASETAQGLDLEVRLDHGQLQHNLLLSYVSDRDLVAFPGADPFVGAGGYDPDNFGAIPRWKGNYRVDWALDRFDVGYSAQWIGSLTESGGELFPETRRHVGGVVYHDLRLGYDWRGNARVTLGVENLGDKQPPFLANADEANTDVSTYRLLGRTFWLRMRLALD